MDKEKFIHIKLSDHLSVQCVTKHKSTVYTIFDTCGHRRTAGITPCFVGDDQTSQ